MALIERPYDFCYSKNDIRYVFQLEALDRPNLVLQIKLFSAKMDDTDFTEVTTFFLKPDPQGKVFLYIQAYINSMLDYVMPVMGSAVTNASDQCCRFYIHSREMSDDDIPTKPWSTSEQGFERIAIKGGIEKFKARGNNIFINYFEMYFGYLTWQPANRFVQYNEPVYLSFLNRERIQFKLRVRIVATDDTRVEIFLPHTDTGVLMHLNVSAAFFNLQAAMTKQIYYYEVAVLANTVDLDFITNPYRFYMEYRQIYQSYDLVFHNSLGGIDSVRVASNVNLAYTITTTEATGGKNTGDAVNQVKAHERFFADIQLQRKYKGNIGLLKTRTKQHQEALLELLVSKGLYMLHDQRWLPVLSVNESVNLGSRKDVTDGFPIEWQLTETNDVYTPMSVMLGAGDTEPIVYIKQFTVINNSSRTVDNVDLRSADTSVWIHFPMSVAPDHATVVPYDFTIGAMFLYLSFVVGGVLTTARILDADGNEVGSASSTASFINIPFTSITDIFTIEVSE